VSRRAPSGPPARRQGWVYTLHFDPPYPADAPEGAQQAKHYTGWATDLETRLADHNAGYGARLTQVQLAAGGTWRVAKVEPGTVDRETQLKERGATRRCPVCITERAMRLIAQWQAEAEPEAGA
jgi:predicted GIY-YIG superfamily endonuclease